MARAIPKGLPWLPFACDHGGRCVPESPRFSRVLQVLEHVARAEQPPRIAHLVEECGLPKATVHRICRHLREQDYLEEALGGKGLVPGPRLIELSEFIFANRAQNASRHTILQAIAKQIGETCNIAVPNGTHMRYVDRVETEWPLKVQLPIGTKVPLHCTASGKLFLAMLPAGRRRRVMERIELERCTPNTIVDKSALADDLDAIADAGIGTDDEEFIEGMVAISAPLRDQTGRLFATLSFHAPVVRMSLDTARQHTETLLAAAQDLAIDTMIGKEGDEQMPR